MIYVIDLLDGEDLKYVNDLFDSADFREGKTSGGIVKDLKNNLEISKGYEWSKLQQYVVKKKNKSETFLNITTAKQYSGVLFAKYESGMYYNSHVDDYSMENGGRTDCSVTIFLNDPEEYEGGELQLTIGNQEYSYKLKSGQCLIYPTGVKHKINPVKSGIRKVCVLWVESCISDIDIRNMMADYYFMWSKYSLDILEKIGSDAYNDILNIKMRLMRKFGNFTGVDYGK